MGYHAGISHYSVRRLIAIATILAVNKSTLLPECCIADFVSAGACCCFYLVLFSPPISFKIVIIKMCKPVRDFD